MSDRVDVHCDVLSLLRYQAAERGDQAALEADDGSCVSYSELLSAVLGWASFLRPMVRAQGHPGRMGLVFNNGLDFSIVLLGAVCAGTAVPFNPAYKQAEFERYFLETRIDFLLLDAKNSHGPAQRAATTLNIKTQVVDDYQQAPSGDPSELDPAFPSATDVAVLLLTSGTTGRCKAVPLTHRNICTSARDVSLSLRLTTQDRCLSMWEQYHIGGLVDLLLAPLHSGGTVIVTSGFAAQRFFALWSAKRPTWFQGVPTTLAELIKHHERAPQAIPQVHSLRLIRSVAAALPAKLKKQLAQVFSVPIIETFGMTEAAPLITSTSLSLGAQKSGSVGRPCGPEVVILGPDFEPCDALEQGQVGIRGDNVFAGYENDETPFVRGWFLTGDLGYLDDEGDLFLTGRVKDLINRGGEKINCQELDTAVLELPEIDSAAAFSVPHKTLGESVALAVIRKAGCEISEQQILSRLREKLADFKLPQRVLFATTLPTNSLGKIDRAALSSLYEATTTEPSASSPVEGEVLAVLERMRSVLDDPSLGASDNFFEAGGHSLLALELMRQIEGFRGRRLPASLILEHPTAATLAAALGRQHGNVRLVRFFPDRAGQSLICVPGVYGDSMEFLGLARQLQDSQALAAIESSGICDGPKDFQDSVADLLPLLPAAGPLRIIGYSAGGTIAFEIARQWELIGREVELLGIIDSAAPGYHHGRFMQPFRVRNILTLLRDLPPWLGNLDCRRVLPEIRSVLLGFLHPDRKTSIHPDGARIPPLYQQAIAYQPRAKFHGPTVIFRAETQLLRSGHFGDLGWGTYCTHVKVRAIAGDHQGFLKAPGELAELLRR